MEKQQLSEWVSALVDDETLADGSYEQDIALLLQTDEGLREELTAHWRQYHYISGIIQGHKKDAPLPKETTGNERRQVFNLAERIKYILQDVDRT